MDPEATTKMQVTQDGTDEKDVGIRFDKSSKYSKKCKIITALSVFLVLVIILIVVLVLVTRKDEEPTPLPTAAPTGWRLKEYVHFLYLQHNITSYIRMKMLKTKQSLNHPQL